MAGLKLPRSVRPAELAGRLLGTRRAKPSQRKESTPPLLIACFPKSGSTFLLSVLRNLPGYKWNRLVPATDRREQELDIRYLRNNAGPPWVGRLHIRASAYTLELIREFEVKPVVLVRDIHDAIVSLTEHVAATPEIPFAYFDKSFLDLPPDKRLAAVTELTGPWFINFYVSWWHAFPDAFVSYEEIVLGGIDPLYDWLTGLGIKVSKEIVAAAAEKSRSKNTRFNVGVRGRGEAMLPAESKATLRRLASYYPEVDFSRIGL